MKKLVSLGLVLVMVWTSGCSVAMVATEPGEKEMNVLKPGTEREKVARDLGTPYLAKQLLQNDEFYDIHKTIDGYGTGSKVARGVGFFILDLATLCIMEFFLFPTEMALKDGDEMIIKVVYTKDGLVKEAYKKVKSEDGKEKEVLLDEKDPRQLKELSKS